MSLGATLRQAREARKVTREQLSRSTRIPVHIITAMEQDEWTRVPGGIFTRGYLRAYGRETGLDGDALAARFVAEHAPSPAPPAEEEGTPRASTAEPGRRLLRWRLPALPEPAKTWLTWSALLPVPLLLGLVLVNLTERTVVRDERQAPPPVPTAAARPTDASGGRAIRPVGTAANLAGSDAPAPTALDASPAADIPLVVEVSVTRPCWVTARVDGARTVYRIVSPGDRVQTRGRELVLRVGDAGAVQLTLDGQAAPPIGRSGAVVNLRITRENYRLLRSGRSPWS